MGKFDKFRSLVVKTSQTVLNQMRETFFFKLQIMKENDIYQLNGDLFSL